MCEESHCAGAPCQASGIGTVPSDFELNFGSHLPRLGRSGSDDRDTQP